MRYDVCETQQRQINNVNVSQKYIDTETNVIMTVTNCTLQYMLRNGANRSHFCVLFQVLFFVSVDRINKIKQNS